MRMCLCGCGRVLYALNARRQYHAECDGRPMKPKTRKWPKKRTVAEQRAWKAAQAREAAHIEALFQAARRARLLRRAA